MTAFSENTQATALQDRLLNRTKDMFMLPEVASEALEVSKDPDCGTQQLACIVERDVKLAAEVLQIANSPVFAGRSTIVDLRQAIVRLGLRQCRNLILTTSAASLIQKLPLEQEWVRSVLWQHSFVTATTCVHLNRALELDFHGEEFTAGLLHDFGRLLFAVAVPEQFAQADDLSFVENDQMLERERSILGMDHCQLGAWFASNQGLPQPLVDVIANHHSPDRVSKADDPLTALVGAADHIANHIQRFEEEVCYDPRQNDWLDVLGLQRDAPLKRQFFDVANELLAAVLEDCDLTERSCRTVGEEAY